MDLWISCESVRRRIVSPNQFQARSFSGYILFQKSGNTIDINLVLKYEFNNHKRDKSSIKLRKRKKWMCNGALSDK